MSRQKSEMGNGSPQYSITTDQVPSNDNSTNHAFQKCKIVMWIIIAKLFWRVHRDSDSTLKCRSRTCLFHRGQQQFDQPAGQT